MGLWKKIEEKLWTGQVLKDYGIVSERRIGAATRKISVLLASKDGQRHFFIRVVHRTFLSANLSFVDLDREAALKLKMALDDALGQL
jgi:hypothetical protein